MQNFNYSVAQLIEIISDNICKDDQLEDIILVGIVTRGYPLAQRIAENIFKKKGIRIPLGKLDITLYRDDLEDKKLLTLKETLMPAEIDNKIVVLVDDVLFKGRTTRAAIEHILDYGRPKYIRLAVLVDRGHRELPICADYTGLYLKTSLDNSVKISLLETDGKDNIELI